VDAFELFLVGRRLMKIAQDAMPAVGADELPASVRSVMVDVFAHPDSSVGEIAARTGFPQSHVSASIARLREAGVLVTAVDLADRRRLLIRRSPDTRPDHPAPVDDAVAEALGTDEHLQPVLAALETLARHLNR
jgi:DNA-binding transcriptional ArsR family regulator